MSGRGHPASESRLARGFATVLRTRWMVRAPIWLYRARLGFVFGSRCLMLEHIGRTSGRRRYVVLEVIDDSVPGRYVIASGFGERAQWLRNIIANPHVTITVGSRRPRAAIAQRLDPAAAQDVLSRYAAAHPRAWARLRPALELTLGSEADGSARELPLVAFTTTGGPASAQS